LENKSITHIIDYTETMPYRWPAALVEGPQSGTISQTDREEGQIRVSDQSFMVHRAPNVVGGYVCRWSKDVRRGRSCKIFPLGF
jgi:hypothetical protein